MGRTKKRTVDERRAAKEELIAKVVKRLKRKSEAFLVGVLIWLDMAASACSRDAGKGRV
jgi:hypothetical protein